MASTLPEIRRQSIPDLPLGYDPPMKWQDTRAAVIQAAPVAFDKDATLTRLAQLLADASARGAALAVLPEAFVGGYPKGADFGVRVGSRSAAGREAFARYFAGAIDVPGPATERIGELAQVHGLHIVVGVIERAGGTLYCTALFFDNEGRLIGKHRKLVPTAAERFLWGRGDGSTITVCDTPIGKIGAAICWENRMPLLRYALYERGVELYCAPTVDDRESWIPSMRHIAMEGRCFVLSACQFAKRSDYPADWHTEVDDTPSTPLIRGGSCIIDPFGQVLAGPVYDETAILIADLAADTIIRGRFDFDVAGHYARPDVFHFCVRASPNTMDTRDARSRRRPR